MLKHETEPQVLIPGTRKTMPHLWRVPLAVARGEVGWNPDGEIDPRAVKDAEDAVGDAIQRKMKRATTGRRRRYFSGGTPYRNPNRIHRLRKNGRLRAELR